jgi:hypothetical protein
MSFSSSSSSSYSLSTHASRLRNWLAFAGFIFETIFGLTRLMLAILVSSLGINFWQWGSGCFNHFLFKYQVSILRIYDNATTQGGGTWTKEKTHDHGPTFVDIDANVSTAPCHMQSQRPVALESMKVVNSARLPSAGTNTCSHLLKLSTIDLGRTTQYKLSIFHLHVQNESDHETLESNADSLDRNLEDGEIVGSASGSCNIECYGLYFLYLYS